MCILVLDKYILNGYLSMTGWTFVIDEYMCVRRLLHKVDNVSPSATPNSPSQTILDWLV